MKHLAACTRLVRRFDTAGNTGWEAQWKRVAQMSLSVRFATAGGWGW
jgi:mannose/cellobiose epimerase-like protein (N-acyl-D-glucosamine 2-epimerase family)